MKVLLFLFWFNLISGLLGLSLNVAQWACCAMTSINVVLIVIAYLNILAACWILAIIIRNRTYAP